jgi:serine/threonine-protein kinase HipA
MKELRVVYAARGQSLWLGTLADDGADVLFQYSPEAIASAIAFSPIRLPLRPQAYPDHQRDYAHLMRLPGLVYDALPDGWGLLLMDRRMRARGIDTNTVSVLDRLAYLGDNTMGALTFEPAALVVAGRDLTMLEMASEVRAVLTDDSRAVLAELAVAGGSAGGARPKIVAFYDPQTDQMSTQEGRMPGAQPWLFKFPASADSADSCALEASYARMAERAGLGMEASRFVPMPNGLAAFGSRRFDRDSLGRRIHVQSLAGLLHADYRLPSVGYVEFMQATRRLTRDKRELVKALRRCVFNVIMNNRDDHGKNLAFMLNEHGDWVLAPPYDLTYAPGPGGEHFMDVAGEGLAPTRAHVLEVAHAGGLKPAEAGKIIDTMLAQLTVAALRQEAAQFPVGRRTLDAVATALEVNRHRLS